MAKESNTAKINALFGSDLAEPAGSSDTNINKEDVIGFDPNKGKVYSLKAKPGKSAKSKPAEETK